MAALLAFLAIVPFAQDALLLHGSIMLSIVVLDIGADEPSSELETM